MLLAINRCLSFSRYKYIFDGPQQYFFMALPIGLTIYVLLFGMSASYSPVYNAWFFDPHRGYYNDVVGKVRTHLVSIKPKEAFSTAATFNTGTT
jgi:hypothetical protein